MRNKYQRVDLYDSNNQLVASYKNYRELAHAYNLSYQHIINRMSDNGTLTVKTTYYIKPVLRKD